MRHLFLLNRKSIEFMTDNPLVILARVSVRKRILNLQKDKSWLIDLDFRLGESKQAPTTYDMIADICALYFNVDTVPTLKDRQIF